MPQTEASEHILHVYSAAACLGQWAPTVTLVSAWAPAAAVTCGNGPAVSEKPCLGLQLDTANEFTVVVSASVFVSVCQ